MPRYAAFLRAVGPMNATSAALKRAFESAGFTNVKTIRSSGNVAFNARAASEVSLQRKAEAAMLQELGNAFFTIVRPLDALQGMLDSDPYRAFRLPTHAKRIVTFLRDRPASRLALPIEQDGARILLMKGREVFSAYVPSPKGPVFMALIEKTLGKDVTTRTWDTVAMVTRA